MPMLGPSRGNINAFSSSQDADVLGWAAYSGDLHSLLEEEEMRGPGQIEAPERHSEPGWGTVCCAGQAAG